MVKPITNHPHFIEVYEIGYARIWVRVVENGAPSILGLQQLSPGLNFPWWLSFLFSHAATSRSSGGGCRHLRYLQHLLRILVRVPAVAQRDPSSMYWTMPFLLSGEPSSPVCFCPSFHLTEFLLEVLNEYAKVTGKGWAGKGRI